MKKKLERRKEEREAFRVEPGKSGDVERMRILRKASVVDDTADISAALNIVQGTRRSVQNIENCRK